MKRVFLAVGLLVSITALNSACKNHTSNDSGEETFTYFKVGEINTNHNESFIIALSDSALIAQARLIIEHPEQTTDKIIDARIVRQTGNEAYLNRDLNNNYTWSWRVETVQGFAFNSIEIVDGWPGYIEEDIDRWFQNTAGGTTHGFIGFWNYTVLEEIDPSQVQ